MKNKRSVAFRNVEIRGTEESGGGKIVEGIIPYGSKSVPMWGVTEIISRTAFNKTLADGTEVRALVNHDDGKVLGSTKSGTLELSSSGDGLLCRCLLPETSYARDLFEVIRRGDVKTMSFGFIPVKWDDTDNGKTRTLREVELKEISYGVAFPAYPETDSKTLVRKINMDLEKLNGLLEKEKLTEEELKELKAAADAINGVIEKNAPESAEKTDAEKEAEGKEAAEREQPGGTPGEGTSGKDAPGREPEDKEEIKKELLKMIDLLFELDKEPEPEEPEPEETEEE